MSTKTGTRSKSKKRFISREKAVDGGDDVSASNELPVTLTDAVPATSNISSVAPQTNQTKSLETKHNTDSKARGAKVTAEGSGNRNDQLKGKGETILSNTAISSTTTSTAASESLADMNPVVPRAATVGSPLAGRSTVGGLLSRSAATTAAIYASRAAAAASAAAAAISISAAAAAVVPASIPASREVPNSATSATTSALVASPASSRYTTQDSRARGTARRPEVSISSQPPVQTAQPNSTTATTSQLFHHGSSNSGPHTMSDVRAAAAAHTVEAGIGREESFMNVSSTGEAKGNFRGTSVVSNQGTINTTTSGRRFSVEKNVLKRFPLAVGISPEGLRQGRDLASKSGAVHPTRSTSETVDGHTTRYNQGDIPAVSEHVKQTGREADLDRHTGRQTSRSADRQNELRMSYTDKHAHTYGDRKQHMNTDIVSRTVIGEHKYLDGHSNIDADRQHGKGVEFPQNTYLQGQAGLHLDRHSDVAAVVTRAERTGNWVNSQTHSHIDQHIHKRTCTLPEKRRFEGGQSHGVDAADGLRSASEERVGGGNRVSWSPKLTRARVEKAKDFWRTKDQSSFSSVSTASACPEDHGSQSSIYADAPPGAEVQRSRSGQGSSNSTPSHNHGNNLEQFWQTCGSVVTTAPPGLPFPTSHMLYYSTAPYESSSLPPFRGSTNRIITASKMVRDSDLLEDAPTGRLARRESQSPGSTTGGGRSGSAGGLRSASGNTVFTSNATLTASRWGSVKQRGSSKNSSQEQIGATDGDFTAEVTGAERMGRSMIRNSERKAGNVCVTDPHLNSKCKSTADSPILKNKFVQEQHEERFPDKEKLDRLAWNASKQKEYQSVATSLASSYGPSGEVEQVSPGGSRRILPIRGRAHTTDLVKASSSVTPGSESISSDKWRNSSSVEVSTETTIAQSSNKPPHQSITNRSPLILRRGEHAGRSRPASMHEDTLHKPTDISNSMKNFQNVDELSQKISQLPASSVASTAPTPRISAARRNSIKWFRDKPDNPTSWINHPIILNRTVSLDKLQMPNMRKSVSLIYFSRTSPSKPEDVAPSGKSHVSFDSLPSSTLGKLTESTQENSAMYTSATSIDAPILSDVPRSPKSRISVITASSSSVMPEPQKTSRISPVVSRRVGSNMSHPTSPLLSNRHVTDRKPAVDMTTAQGTEAGGLSKLVSPTMQRRVNTSFSAPAVLNKPHTSVSTALAPVHSTSSVTFGPVDIMGEPKRHSQEQQQKQQQQKQKQHKSSSVEDKQELPRPADVMKLKSAEKRVTTAASELSASTSTSASLNNSHQQPRNVIQGSLHSVSNLTNIKLAQPSTISSSNSGTSNPRSFGDKGNNNFTFARVLTGSDITTELESNHPLPSEALTTSASMSTAVSTTASTATTPTAAILSSVPSKVALTKNMSPQTQKRANVSSSTLDVNEAGKPVSKAPGASIPFYFTTGATGVQKSDKTGNKAPKSKSVLKINKKQLDECIDEMVEKALAVQDVNAIKDTSSDSKTQQNAILKTTNKNSPTISSVTNTDDKLESSQVVLPDSLPASNPSEDATTKDKHTTSKAQTTQPVSVKQINRGIPTVKARSLLFARSMTDVTRPGTDFSLKKLDESRSSASVFTRSISTGANNSKTVGSAADRLAEIKKLKEFPKSERKDVVASGAPVFGASYGTRQISAGKSQDTLAPSTNKTATAVTTVSISASSTAQPKTKTSPFQPRSEKLQNKLSTGTAVAPNSILKSPKDQFVVQNVDSCASNRSIAEPAGQKAETNPLSSASTAAEASSDKTTVVPGIKKDETISSVTTSSTVGTFLPGSPRSFTSRAVLQRSESTVSGGTREASQEGPGALDQNKSPGTVRGMVARRADTWGGAVAERTKIIEAVRFGIRPVEISTASLCSPTNLSSTPVGITSIARDAAIPATVNSQASSESVSKVSKSKIDVKADGISKNTNLIENMVNSTVQKPQPSAVQPFPNFNNISSPIFETTDPISTPIPGQAQRNYVPDLELAWITDPPLTQFLEAEVPSKEVEIMKNPGEVTAPSVLIQVSAEAASTAAAQVSLTCASVIPTESTLLNRSAGVKKFTSELVATPKGRPTVDKLLHSASSIKALDSPILVVSEQVHPSVEVKSQITEDRQNSSLKEQISPTSVGFSEVPSSAHSLKEAMTSHFQFPPFSSLAEHDTDSSSVRSIPVWITNDPLTSSNNLPLRPVSFPTCSANPPSAFIESFPSINSERVSKNSISPLTVISQANLSPSPTSASLTKAPGADAASATNGREVPMKILSRLHSDAVRMNELDESKRDISVTGIPKEASPAMVAGTINRQSIMVTPSAEKVNSNVEKQETRTGTLINTGQPKTQFIDTKFIYDTTSKAIAHPTTNVAPNVSSLSGIGKTYTKQRISAVPELSTVMSAKEAELEKELRKYEPRDATLEARRRQLIREDSFNRPDSPMFHQLIELPKESIIRRHRRRLDRQQQRRQMELLGRVPAEEHQLDSLSDSSSSSSCSNSKSDSGTSTQRKRIHQMSPQMQRRHAAALTEQSFGTGPRALQRSRSPKGGRVRSDPSLLTTGPSMYLTPSSRSPQPSRLSPRHASSGPIGPSPVQAPLPWTRSNISSFDIGTRRGEGDSNKRPARVRSWEEGGGQVSLVRPTSGEPRGVMSRVRGFETSQSSTVLGGPLYREPAVRTNFGTLPTDGRADFVATSPIGRESRTLPANQRGFGYIPTELPSSPVYPGAGRMVQRVSEFGGTSRVSPASQTSRISPRDFGALVDRPDPTTGRIFSNFEDQAEQECSSELSSGSGEETKSRSRLQGRLVSADSRGERNNASAVLSSRGQSAPTSFIGAAGLKTGEQSSRGQRFSTAGRGSLRS